MAGQESEIDQKEEPTVNGTMNVVEALKQGLIDYESRPEGIEEIVLDHAFIGMGFEDDAECTYRADGTDATYCGMEPDAHVCPHYWPPSSKAEIDAMRERLYPTMPSTGPRGFEVGVRLVGLYFDGYGPGGSSND